MLGATRACLSQTLASTIQAAELQMRCSYSELVAAARCSLLQQQALLLQRMLSSNAQPIAPPAAASAKQQHNTTATIPATPAAPKLNPLQPYIPPGLILPKVPGSSSAVRNAEFAAGAYSLAQLPPERWPEVAVVGRSNVGKSSLINCMLGSSSLAKVSKHPGGMHCCCWCWCCCHGMRLLSWYLVKAYATGFFQCLLRALRHLQSASYSSLLATKRPGIAQSAACTHCCTKQCLLCMLRSAVS
jgi:hypothetical protein